MVKKDEEALICDLAETYNILDYKSVPLSLISVLAKGLSYNSRIKTAISEEKVPIDFILQASIIDRLSLLVWANSKDAVKGKNRPKSIVESLKVSNGKKDNHLNFTTGEEFERRRKNIIERIKNGNRNR